MDLPRLSQAKDTVRRRLLQTRSLATLPTTRRDTLLALSEIARRQDVPLHTTNMALQELRVFSQNGEDGVLAEIIRRTAAPTRTFVEIGAGTGQQNNTALLADVFGWGGLLVDGDPHNHQRLERKYAARADITTLGEMVGAPNIGELPIPDEFDLLSIDVDGPDYFLWQALTQRPRIVVIEYNSALEGRQVHSPERRDGLAGTSLEGMRKLGEEKGYRLVYLELTGNNAFFVRDDLPGEYEPVMPRGPNHFLAALSHDEDPAGRQYTDLDAA